ncbi:MAG: thiamine diphosphokinase [Lachnospiraceae bacterium]|nr:thiamine diphosphokinase [Lachnospiraceae bacterium]
MNKTEGKCILIGAGDLTISGIPVGEEDLCIAVDGGFSYCKLLGIEPHYVLGDFDSLGMGMVGSDGSETMEETDASEEFVALKKRNTPEEELAEYERIHPGRVIRIPKEKDDTDMLAALRLGLERGYRSFHLYGGSGGRLEHTIANIQCLLYLKEQGATGYMMDGTGMILVAKEEAVSFQESLEGYLSLFSLGEKAEVSIERMKYPLDHYEVTNSFPIGISNEFIGEKGCITVHKGAVVIIISWVE